MSGRVLLCACQCHSYVHPLMLFAIINVVLVQLGLVGEDIFGDEPPNWNVLVAKLLEELRSVGQAGFLRRIDEHLQFDNAGTFHDDAAEHLDEGDGGAEGAARGHQIVNDEDALSLGDLVALHGQSGAVAVLGFVVVGRDGVGHLALLAHHDEGLLQRQRDGRSQDEAAGIEAGNDVHIQGLVPFREDVDDLLEDGWFVQESANVVEARDALEWEVRQVLRDFLGLWPVLFVCAHGGATAAATAATAATAGVDATAAVVAASRCWIAGWSWDERCYAAVNAEGQEDE
mmetsp:Transcript_7527/g.20355  ORF Transcript_7527/g.20355 Transcript_7527/m.20355 type:complete len:287 (+) Transcript_7527:1984-2844(+)